MSDLTPTELASLRDMAIRAEGHEMNPWWSDAVRRLLDLIDSLTRERDELAATVERLDERAVALCDRIAHAEGDREAALADVRWLRQALFEITKVANGDQIQTSVARRALADTEEVGDRES